MRLFHIHDGDGHAVIEDQRTRTSVNQTWPSFTRNSYQIWSTVLGSGLTTINPNGTKLETKVFAGGAHIASQGSGGVEWKTADPVTGPTAVYSGSSAYKEEETEPLGQKIELTAPPAPASTYSEVLTFAKDPRGSAI